MVEIADQYEPKFPGFRVFTRLVDEVPALPAGWQQVLRSVKGVYLLVDVESGHQYVGSAKGADSLFGRWMDYAADGHGGDKALKAAAAAAGGRRSYQVSVLEVVDANVPDDTIEQIESYWKTKLLTRTFGLNRNWLPSPGGSSVGSATLEGPATAATASARGWTSGKGHSTPKRPPSMNIHRFPVPSPGRSPSNRKTVDPRLPRPTHTPVRRPRPAAQAARHSTRPCPWL